MKESSAQTHAHTEYKKRNFGRLMLTLTEIDRSKKFVFLSLCSFSNGDAIRISLSFNFIFSFHINCNAAAAVWVLASRVSRSTHSSAHSWVMTLSFLRKTICSSFISSFPSLLRFLSNLFVLLHEHLCCWLICLCHCHFRCLSLHHLEICSGTFQFNENQIGIGKWV